MSLCPSDSKPCECQPDAYEYCRDNGIAQTQAAYEKELSERQREILLLRNVHHFARSLMRNNGVDKDRADKAYDAMATAVHAVIEFDNEQ